VSVFQRSVQWHPEVHLSQILRLVVASRRMESRRSASVSLLRVHWRPLAHLGKNYVVWRRRDAWRQFSNILSNGIRRNTYGKYGVFWQRRDDWRRFTSVVSNVIPRLTFTKYSVFWRRPDPRRWFYNWSFGVPRLLLASYAVRSRRGDSASRRSA
jgi:hypothetical protein